MRVGGANGALGCRCRRATQKSALLGAGRLWPGARDARGGARSRGGAAGGRMSGCNRLTRRARSGELSANTHARHAAAAPRCAVTWHKRHPCSHLALPPGPARRKQSAHGLVLAALRREMARPAYAGAARALAGVVDPVRSAVFDSIKF